ncbi:MAG: TPM domain-containing protein [Bacteroidales bacterium]|nr:TPM domain-containing protein [Bacteroidales bacterium]
MFCLWLAVAFFMSPAWLWGQAEWTPPKSDRLVNDYSHVLSDGQRSQLEQRLVDFNDSTSNQIVVVITPTLHHDDINAVGQRIGQQWGVGQSEWNNGLVIIIKSKTEDEPDGEVAIATGYGLEGALPDIFCRRIIDDEMIPHLAEGDYYEAIDAALDVILPVAAGEYSYSQYVKDGRRSALITLLIALLLIGVPLFFFIRYARKHGGDHWFTGTGGPFIGGFGGGTGHGGFGGGSFGGGGFGGFGGGSFGGGGASGRF